MGNLSPQKVSHKSPESTLMSDNQLLAQSYRLMVTWKSLFMSLTLALLVITPLMCGVVQQLPRLECKNLKVILLRQILLEPVGI